MMIGRFLGTVLFWDMQKRGKNAEYKNFQGCFYAVATDIDQKTDKESMNAELDKFLGEIGFERDTSRLELGNVITSPLAQQIMGYEQMNYYFPIKVGK